MTSIRKLIKALLLETPELQGAFAELQYNREAGQMTDISGLNSSGVFSSANPGTMHRDELETTFGKDKAGEYIDLKREMKKFWNENADHAYWKTVKCVHSLGYYSSNSGDPDRGEVDATVEQFIQKHPPGQGQRDEMSCYGIIGSERPEVLEGQMAIIISGRVTFASTEDAFSESRGAASSNDIKRHKGSGLPKRPNLGGMDEDSALFDEEDVRNSRQGYIEELIVDNWTWDTLIWPWDPIGDSIHKEVLALNKIGVRVVDESFDEYLYTEEELKQLNEVNKVKVTKRQLRRIIKEAIADNVSLEIVTDSGSRIKTEVPYYIIEDALMDGLGVDGLFVEIEEFIDKENRGLSGAYTFSNDAKWTIGKMWKEYQSGGVWSDEKDYEAGFKR